MMLFVSAFAADKDLDKDITMVSYQQSWSDDYGTLALRNNTDEEIKNVVFLITYLDMSGNELDYAEFNKAISIAPGMTKKLDIKAYERSRRYHYYKSEGLYDNTSFKIKFQLKDYNVDQSKYNSIEDNNDGGHLWMYMLFVLLFGLSLIVGLYVIVAVMAKKRNRSVILWLLLSLIATPFLVIIILLCVGKDDRNSSNNDSLLK